MLEECRYKQRAGLIASYYARPMALRIVDLRKAKNLSQEELASKAGISRSQLAQIETESRPANTLRLNAIAAALGVETWQLFELPEYSAAIVDMMESISEQDQRALVRMAQAFAAQN